MTPVKRTSAAPTLVVAKGLSTRVGGAGFACCDARTSHASALSLVGPRCFRCHKTPQSKKTKRGALLEQFRTPLSLQGVLIGRRAMQADELHRHLAKLRDLLLKRFDHERGG